MSSGSAHIGQETGGHIAPALFPSTSFLNDSKDLRGNESADRGQNNERSQSLKARTMRDMKEAQRRFEKFVVPSVREGEKEEKLQSSRALPHSNLVAEGENVINCNVVDEQAQKRFLCQPWSFFRDFLELSKTKCDIGTEEHVSKTKEKKVAVLPHSKYPIYGYCPSRDEYVVVKCKLCGMAVKPVIHRAHMHSRHNIGLKSPEPSATVASVISPSLPSSSSELASPMLCSTVETAPSTDDAMPLTAASQLVEPVTSKAAKKGNTAAKKSSLSATGPVPKDASSSAADNYVVVAPHSSDRPLKLTFRRSNAILTRAAAISEPVRGSGSEHNEPKKAFEAAHSRRPDVKPSGSMRTRLRHTKVVSVASCDEPVQQDKKAPEVTKKSDTITGPSNHITTPSTSAANMVELVGSEPVTSASKTPTAPAAATIFTASAAVSSNSYQHHVYEHPRPLAVCRYDRRSYECAPSMPDVSLPKSSEDHLCYVLTDYVHNNYKRWSTFRRSSQSLRHACRRMFTAQGNELNARYRQSAPTLAAASGSEERTRANEATAANKWAIGGNGNGQLRHVIGNAHKSSSVTIMRHTGLNNRVVRLTNPVKNCNSDGRQPGPSILIAGSGRYSAGAPSAASNAVYTKVNNSQVKVASVESGTSHMAIDLGSLVSNGDSTTQFRLEPAAIISATPNQTINDRKIATKRPTPPTSYASSIMSTFGSGCGSVTKKPRLQKQETAVIEIEEVSSIDANGQMIQSAGIKPSLSHAYARQQLMNAIHHAHDSSGGARRKFSQAHSVRHQLTPIVISPSQTPRCASPRPQQLQQQQVVLVSVNGPAVLTGWQKLTTNSSTGEQSSQQSGFLQNGLTVTAVGAMETATTVGARVLRPKAPVSQGAVPLLVAHSDQIHARRQYRHVHGLIAQRLSTSAGTRVTSTIHGMKKPTQARLPRRAGSAAVSPVEEGPVFQFAHQQPLAQYRPIQPAHQHGFGQSGVGTLRSTAVTSTQQLIAAPIVFSVAAVAKGGSNAHVSAQSAASPVTVFGQQFSQQSPASTTASPPRTFSNVF